MRLVIRVKGGLVPFSTKINARLIVRAVSQSFSNISVLIIVMHPIVSLKKSMMKYNPIILITYIGPQQCCCYLRVVSRCNDISDIMEQRTDYSFFISPIAFCTSCSLQTMFQTTYLIGRVSIHQL